MADKEQNPTLQYLFHALDPISLILSHNSLDSHEPVPLKLTTADSCYVMERGPRYTAYAELRESKLRMKSLRPQEPEEMESKQTPPKKQVKFHANLPNSRKGYSSVLGQSVPDFSATLRKENRKPPQMIELTPPPAKNWARVSGVVLSSRGSKSASGGEKKNGGVMARKSCATVDELKGLSMAAASAINGENRGGRGSRRNGNGKTVLGYRQF